MTEALISSTGAAGLEGEVEHRSPRRAEREAAIVSAALEEFRHAGFAAARIDAIAARAGIAKGTIYLYFDTKEDLFKAAVRRLIHPLLDEMEREVAEYRGHTADLLRLAIQRMHTNMVLREDTRELLRLLMAEGSRMPEVAEFFYREIVARGEATIRMILWRGIAQGEFRRSVATDFPQLVLAPAKAAAMSLVLYGDPKRAVPDGYVEAHIAFVLDALRA